MQQNRIISRTLSDIRFPIKVVFLLIGAQFDNLYSSYNYFICRVSFHFKIQKKYQQMSPPRFRH